MDKPVAVTSTIVNQENTALNQKAADAPSAIPLRASTRNALADVKNQTNQAPPKRSTGFKVGKTEDIKEIPVKVGPRRPLRETTASNVTLPAGKNGEQKLPRGAAKNATLPLGTASNSSTLIGQSNNTLDSTAADAETNKTKPSVPFVASKFNAAAAIAKPRLQRTNAVSSLHSAKANFGSNTTKSEAGDLVSLALAPLKEENENTATGSPERDNAYSSAMMPNIDAGDEDNPQLVSAYVNDIYNYLRLLERQQNIKENFLEGKEVNGRMRSILIDWLSQVHIRFHLLPETLYMTVALIDRFLQEVSVPKEKLQLVGVTSMFIASKYEEMYAPEIGDFVYITDHSCSKQEIRAMECLLLHKLGFSLGRPLPIHFLRRYSKVADADATKHTLAKYFLELSLVCYPLCHFPPSIMAAAALWLSLKLLDPVFEWSATLVYYTKYQESDFMSCVRRLCRAIVKTHTKEIKQQAIRNKFSTSKFMDISKHPCLDMTRIRKYGEC